MSEKLLPCPFCGSTEVMKFPPTCHEYSPYNPSDRAAPMVRCADCFAEAYGRDFDKSCKTAIAAWNRRAPAPVTAVKKDIICHAPGDRCLGCAHYHGKADVCACAPSPAPVIDAPGPSSTAYDESGYAKEPGQ